MELVIRRFDELTLDELYEIIKLRVDVFVVEQNCVYQDLDDKDKSAFHVFLKDDNGIEAYLRVMQAQSDNNVAVIGRVISIKRRCGLGTKVLTAGIEVAKTKFNAKSIKLAAQTYARRLYEKAGFKQVSDEFLEDGIPHIEMILNL
ncbi:MAG: GNAT family N-acetyltransferase [Faecalibacterium sp.]|nr:GNAT family N-acetyltransferase [Ruminococcus sp.]MCM1391658.1 GNAT family N-acetyltransferase [Ruminococcus sp.]MCM1486217.1 GNAT family N-acetyltransferase [Faecalibacterium sp.]